MSSPSEAELLVLRLRNEFAPGEFSGVKREAFTPNISNFVRSVAQVNSWTEIPSWLLDKDYWTASLSYRFKGHELQMFYANNFKGRREIHSSPPSQKPHN